MSSHREAPEISKDPVADNADVYAFVSPDNAGTVTIISNFVPLQSPSGGPNFFEFGNDVLYSIYIDNDGDTLPEIEYQFQFSTNITNPNTFLYNTGPIGSLTDPAWNRRQLYSVTRIDVKGHGKPGKGGSGSGPDGHGPGGAGGGPGFAKGPQSVSQLGTGLACPPCNIGPRSTPNYDTALVPPAIHSLPSGEKVFCGQRNDGFFVDLGAVFDLADLRPFSDAHLIPIPGSTTGVDDTKALNIHAIAIQIPIGMLTRDGSVPTDVKSAKAVLGIWSAASRRMVRMVDPANDEKSESGPWVQVSRLGNPLFNEVIVPMAKKDEWNGQQPSDDAEYVPNVQHPELSTLLPILYPGATFQNLSHLTAPRADLVAILLTGLPYGVAGAFQNYTGPKPADMLRLNVAVPPTTVNPNPLGLVYGDAAGFPNGRRVFDDVVTVELRAFAGLSYPFVDPKAGTPQAFVPDGAAAAIDQGVGPGPNRYQSTFPYLGSPHDGYSTPPA